MNDYIIFRKIKQGDPLALDQFIEHYYASIHAYVFRIMQGDDRCNDITQEVFIRFMKRLPALQDGTKIKRYLFMIAKHCCMDCLREQSEDDVSTYLETMSNKQDDPHEAMLKTIEKSQMERLIATLPRNQQECLYLRYYENYKIKDIALITGINENTVKSRLRLAIQQVKNKWKEYNHEDHI